MTLLALRALVARVPGIAWVILLTVVLASLGLWGAYRHGRTVERVAVHRTALVDSARVAHKAVATATKITDGRVATAAKWRTKSSTAVTTYHAQRDAITELAAAPLPELVQLVQRADTAIAQLDSTVQLQASALAAFQSERTARIVADSVEAHQLVVGEPERPPDRVKELAIVTAVLVVLALVFR